MFLLRKAVVIYALLLCIFSFTNAYHNLSRPWFLQSSKSLPFATRQDIVDTILLDNGTSFVLAAQNGTKSFSLYRQLGPDSDIDCVKLELNDTFSWAYDNTRKSTSVSFTMQMTTQTIYIVFFSQNRLGVRWFSPIEFQWNSTATISNSNIRSRTTPNTINDANIVLSSQDNSLYVGVHSFNCPPSAANCTGYSLNSFSHSSNSMTWSYDNSERLLSVEFDCRECQSKARLIGPSEIRYFDLVDRSFSSPSTIIPSQQIGPNSYKAYSDNGDTFYAFMLPNSTDPGKMAVYLQLNDRNDNYVDQVQLGPPVPRSLASQQIRIALNVESIVIAFTTDRGSIQNDWDGLYNASLQGDQDTNHEVVVIEISRANFKPSAMLIFSTKGRDRVSSINISPDRIITIMGTTEGHVSSPSTSTDLNLNRAFVVAQFQPFGIDKVSSILNGADVEEGEVVESTNFTVTFKPIPLGMSVNGTPSVYFENLNCMSIMSNATTIMVTPPVLHSAPNPIRFVASPFKLSIEMSHLPYAPKVERYISLKLPVLTDIMPKSVSSLDNKHLNLTLKYFGSLYLNYLRIFVIFDRLNQEYRCEKRPSPDIQLLSESGTILPCSIGAVPLSRGRIMLSFNNFNISTNVSVDFAPSATDISISLTDLRDRNVMLSCRSFDIPDNSLHYHILNNLSTDIAQLRQNDAEIPFGANTNLQTRNVFKIRRSSRDVAGIFAIPWHCTDPLDEVQSSPAKLEITMPPIFNCQPNQAVDDNIVLDTARLNLRNLNMSIVFSSVPDFGRLIDPENLDAKISVGTRYDKPNIKFRVNKDVQSSHRNTSGTFSYYVEQNGLQSEMCNVVFSISCAPRYLNIFDNSTDDLCVFCPTGANCSFTGNYLPYAQSGFWKSEESNVYLPCVPESACPGEPSRTCVEGRKGYRCGECERNWYKLNDECHKCNSNVTETILIISACIIGGAIIVGLVLRLTSAGPGLGFATITINFIQMIIVVRDIKLNWTPEFHLVLNSISFLNFNVELTSPECFILDESINFSLKLRLTLAIPILLFGILAVIALYNSMTMLRLRNRCMAAIARLFRFAYTKMDEASMQRKHTESVYLVLRGFNAIILFVYVTVASKALAFFDCTKMSDGNYYLDADPSLRCNDGEAWRQSDMPIALFGVIFYVIGIPLYFMVQFSLLYQTKKTGPFWTRAKRICIELVSQNSYIKPQFQYFLLIQIIQKLFVIAVKQFFTRYVALQIVLTIGLAMFGYAIYSKYHPYAYVSLNYLEIQSVLSSAIILSLGLLLYTDQFPEEKHKMILTALLLAIIFGFLLSVIVAAVYELHKAGLEKYGSLSNAVTAITRSLTGRRSPGKRTRPKPPQKSRQAGTKKSDEREDSYVA